MFILLFILLAFTRSNAQFDPVYKQFTVNDGLAGNETYHVFQDSKGFIWIATNNGVSLFDGYSFKNFDIQSGLVDNIVFEIYEDYKGRIWFVPFSGALCYYENGTIKPYAYNSKIRQNMPQNSKGPIKLSFYVDSLDNVYLSIKDYGIMHITPEGIFKKMDGINQQGEYVINEMPGSKIIISNPDSPLYKELTINCDKNTLRYPSNILYPGIKANYVYSCKPTKNSFLASIEAGLCFIENNKVQWIDKRFKSIIWLSTNNEYILIGDIDGGLYLSPTKNLESFTPQKILSDYIVTSAMRDNEGGYWVSTLSNGLIYIPDIQIQSITTKNGLSSPSIKAIYAENNKIYLGYQMGWLDIIENGKIKKLKLLNTPGNTTFVRNFLGDRQTGKLWVSYFGHLGYLKDDRFHIIEHKIPIYPRKIIKSRKHENTYWVATAKGIICVSDDKVIYDSRDDGFSAMALAIENDEQDNIWFLTYNGLWKYSNRLFQYLGDENPLLAYSGNSLLYIPDHGELWIGTNGAGIVIMDKKGKIKQITKNEGLISNSITNILTNGNSYWIGTRQGLSLLNLNNNGYHIQNITINDGLVSNDVQTIYISDTLIYAGTTNGVSIINTNKLKANNVKPKTYITSVQVEDSTYRHTSESLRIPYDTKYVIVSYTGLAYRNMGKVLYRYRLLGFDSSWVYTTSTQCLYSVFKPGRFTFEVQAQNSNGIWGESAILNIAVPPPFWQRFWFVLLFAIVISTIFYLIYSIRMNELKRRNELINNINLYKQQSLRQQMNPHFIFNTLNSIQYYILEKDTISSHKYLTKFARLMRFTLDNSMHSAIPLRDELEALKLYLELEALRLQGSFTYNIDYGTNESILETRIPTLMIQPFVENAIWHGIMLKPDKSGHVQITIREMDKQVLCTIEDNGVGREEARKIQEASNKAHRSRGFQITQQRIDLLSSMYGQKFNIQITDLYSADGKPQGTKVSISIPKELDNTK